MSLNRAHAVPVLHEYGIVNTLSIAVLCVCDSPKWCRLLLCVRWYAWRVRCLGCLTSISNIIWIKSGLQLLFSVPNFIWARIKGALQSGSLLNLSISGHVAPTWVFKACCCQTFHQIPLCEDIQGFLNLSANVLFRLPLLPGRRVHYIRGTLCAGEL